VYLEVVHWKKNSFSISRGNSGKAFVNELTHLISAFAHGAALEQVALKASIILPLFRSLIRSLRPKNMQPYWIGDGSFGNKGIAWNSYRREGLYKSGSPTIAPKPTKSKWHVPLPS